jgi:ABC-type microcin C transport system permease subunit YejB
MGLMMSILSDVMYSVVDPRINFDSNWDYDWHSPYDK